MSNYLGATYFGAGYWLAQFLASQGLPAGYQGSVVVFGRATLTIPGTTPATLSAAS